MRAQLGDELAPRLPGQIPQPEVDLANVLLGGHDPVSLSSAPLMRDHASVPFRSCSVPVAVTA